MNNENETITVGRSPEETDPGAETSGDPAGKVAAAGSLGMVTLGFLIGLSNPVPALADSWGDLYYNPDMTMTVCVCSAVVQCAPCVSV